MIRTLARSRVAKAAWRWWDHRRTDVFLLSYPKCGRTWLRTMMGKALVDDLGLTGVDPLELEDVSEATSRLPQLKTAAGVDRDKHRYAGKDVIFLVRDPRDVLISYYFQASKRRDRFHGTPSEFLRHPIGSLDTIIAYFNVWAEARAIPRSFTLVRYEDLHRAPAAELERVLRVVGHVPPRAVLDRAIEFARFDNMRAREAASAPAATGYAGKLAPADAADPESYKTRKGQVGGFRAYLTPEDVAVMNEQIERRLSPFYAEYLAPR